MKPKRPPAAAPPPRTLRTLSLFIMAALMSLPVLGEEGPPGDPAGESNRIVNEGIAIEFEMEPAEPRGKADEGYQEGDLVRFRFRITDTNSDTPLSGVFPAAWMDRRSRGEREVGYEECRDKVEAFIGGSLFSPPELDLNVYYVLALNNDATISVVDPLFGFGTTKLLDMIFLESPGEDWALTSDQKTLFVSMPEVDQVAVADTATWEVVTNLRTGPRPASVALQPDEHYLWVGYEIPPAGSDDRVSGVTVIETEGPSVVKSIPTGRGHHEIAFSSDDRFAYVTNQGDGTLSIIDIRTLERIKQLEIGKSPVSIAYSSQGRGVYVVNQDGGTIVAVDGESHEVIARIQTDPGLGQIKFAPDGRLGFVVNPETSALHILDASVNRIVQSGKVEEGPDQVAFSDHMAYIRHRDSELILMVPLDKAGREGLPIPTIDFPGGQRPFGRASRPSLADAIVQAPGATAVLVANAGDKTIYYYKEGMAAPMGHFQNYSREPRAVIAVDRSLKERSPGAYETVAELRRPGVYDVAFFLDSPRTIHCFQVQVAADPEMVARRLKQRPISIEPVTEPGTVVVGQEADVRFRLIDVATGKPMNGLGGVIILTFRAPGVEREERLAENLGDGIYRVRFVPRGAGVYYSFAGIPASGLNYNKSPFVLLRAEQPSPNRSEAPGSGQGTPVQPGRRH